MILCEGIRRSCTARVCAHVFVCPISRSNIETLPFETWPCAPSEAKPQLPLAMPQIRDPQRLLEAARNHEIHSRQVKVCADAPAMIRMMPAGANHVNLT